MPRLAATLLLIASLLVHVHARAETPEQFRFSVTIGKRIAGTILIVGWPRDKANLDQLVRMVAEHADKAYEALDAGNPASDIARLNKSAGLGPQAVGWQTTEFLAKARELARATGSDIATSGAKDAAADIIIDDAARTIEITKSGIAIRVEPMLEGYLADLMARFIHASGMSNALVNVGSVYRGVGESLHGPWKVEIREDSTTYAKHAMNISASDMGVAIASGSRSAGTHRCKSVTVAMGDAAQAEGLAGMIMEAGPAKGEKLLKKVPGARGLIIDNAGKFTKLGL